MISKDNHDFLNHATKLGGITSQVRELGSEPQASRRLAHASKRKNLIFLNHAPSSKRLPVHSNKKNWPGMKPRTPRPAPAHPRGLAHDFKRQVFDFLNPAPNPGSLQEQRNMRNLAKERRQKHARCKIGHLEAGT